MQQPVDHRARHHAEPLAVGLGQRLPARLVLAQHLLHDLVAAAAQRGDRGHHVERGEPALEARHLLAHERARRLGLGLAHGQVARHRLLEVVHVVERDARAVAHAGLDVARHGEVDQHQRAAHARRWPPARAPRGRRSGAARRCDADHDVGALELAREVVEGDRAAAEALGERRSRGRSGGWPRTASRTPRSAERAGGELARSRRRRSRARGGRSGRRGSPAASSTATEDTDTFERAIVGLACARACRRPARRGRAGWRSGRSRPRPRASS